MESDDVTFSPNYAEYTNRYGYDIDGRLKRLHAAMDKWDRAIAEMLGLARPTTDMSTDDDSIPESIYDEAVWMTLREDSK